MWIPTLLLLRVASSITPCNRPVTACLGPLLHRLGPTVRVRTTEQPKWSIIQTGFPIQQLTAGSTERKDEINNEMNPSIPLSLSVITIHLCKAFLHVEPILFIRAKHISRSPAMKTTERRYSEDSVNFENTKTSVHWNSPSALEIIFQGNENTEDGNICLRWRIFRTELLIVGATRIIFLWDVGGSCQWSGVPPSALTVSHVHTDPAITPCNSLIAACNRPLIPYLGPLYWGLQ